MLFSNDYTHEKEKRVTAMNDLTLFNNKGNINPKILPQHWIRFEKTLYNK